MSRLAVFAIDITQRKQMEEVRGESGKCGKRVPEGGAYNEKDRAFREGGSVFRKGDDSIVISTLNTPVQEESPMISSAGEFAEERKAEDPLRKASERRESVIDHSQIQISELDAEGRYLLIDRAICRMFSKPPRIPITKENRPPFCCPMAYMGSFCGVTPGSWRLRTAKFPGF